jgi:protein-S-isoprenylcysteine O-methyltransferase Ste14
VLVLLEERELRDRFGAEYEEYCRQVPRWIPGRSRRAAARS